jgi:hypothetical protein
MYSGLNEICILYYQTNMLYILESDNSFVDILINIYGSFYLTTTTTYFSMYTESRNRLISRDSPREEITV